MVDDSNSRPTETGDALEKKGKRKKEGPELFSQATHAQVDQPVAPTPSGAKPGPEARRAKFSTKEDRQEFFLPVSGFVWLYEEEVKVVDHPAFQRLGRIYQLGQTYLVYRGATHKRFEHVLGAVAIVQRMIEALEHTGKKGRKRGLSTSWLNIEEERFVRLGTLLHDIGHIAAGHTIEDELGLAGRHDADKRLALVFDGKELVNQDGLTLAKLIDTRFRLYVPDDLAAQGLTAAQIVRLLIRKRPTGEEKKSDPLSKEQTILEGSASIRLNVCRDMIGNTICADLLDYLHRDWYHVGKPRPFDDRLLQYMEIRSPQPELGGQPVPTPDDSFVISLRQSPKIRTDAISNILELLEWRYQLMESVIYHRAKLAGAAMLDRALYELWGRSGGTEIESVLLPLSDEETLSRCLALAADLQKEPGATAKERGRIAQNLLGALTKRQLFEHVSTRFYGDLRPGTVSRIQDAFGKVPGEPHKAAENRNRVLRMLEADFNLEPGSLAMYCPGGVNEKVAEVKIAVGNEILPFCEYEDKYDEELSGGHLKAQLHRFQRLWRIHFFIDRKAKAQMSSHFGLLQRAISKLALADFDDDESNANVARSLAIELTQIPGSPWYSRAVREASPDAGYQTPEISTGRYPLGPNSIRDYLNDANDSGNKTI